MSPDPDSACPNRGSQFHRISYKKARESARDACGACFADDDATLNDADELCIAPEGDCIHQTLADAGGEIHGGGMEGTKPATILERPDVTTLEEAAEAINHG